MRLLLVVLSFVLLGLECHAQLLVKEVPFATATPFLEPDGRNEVVKVSENEFVALCKIKGGLNTESDYLIQKFDRSLNVFFKTPLKLGYEEDVFHLTFNGEYLILYTILHERELAKSQLTASAYNVTTGAKLWDKVLMNRKLSPYAQVRGRGMLEETFEDAICSGLSKDFIVPFDFNFYISYSPDSSKVLIYYVDYGKPHLSGSAIVVDKHLNKINEGIIPVDNNFFNYGIYINNRGELYILNTDRLGRIVLVQYNIETRDYKLLDVQNSSTARQGLKFHFHNDDEIYVGSVNTSDKKLKGVMYVKFNFAENLVEKINYHPLTEGLLQTASAVRSSKFATPENWEHYEITDFVVNKFEKVLFVLEKREISSPDYQYETEAPVEADRWKERAGKLSTESVILVAFNSMDEVMWEDYLAKIQSGEITTAFPSCSYTASIDDERIRLIYASSSQPSGVFNTYNYVEWNAMNGNKVKELVMKNEEGLALVRNYCLWYHDQVILVGRKGLLGKKYISGTYKLNSGNE